MVKGILQLQAGWVNGVIKGKMQIPQKPIRVNLRAFVYLKRVLFSQVVLFTKVVMPISSFGKSLEHW